MRFDDLKYVNLQPGEIVFGKKQFLYIEMEILTSIQRYESYLRLRKQELSVKNLLRRIIIQIKEELEKANNFLPKLPEEKPEIEAEGEIGMITPQMLSKMQLIKAPKANRDLLEEQINEVRRKIAALQ